MTTSDRLVDLHLHTNYSDGVFTPEEAVRYARKVGLSAISITDHDIVDGIPSATAEGEKQGIEVIPGIELSAEVENIQRSEMHILGYYINGQNPAFLEHLALMRKARVERADTMINRFASAGIIINRDDLTRISGRGSIGRLHFAKLLIEMEIVKNIPEAFSKYLGIDKLAYVPKLRMSADEAIRFILKAGGIPVLAHPYYGHYSNRNLLRGLVNAGLKGIEVWHSKHPPSTVKLFTELAEELNLASTGGSDCHGPYGDQPAMMGTVKVPYSIVENLKKIKRDMESGAADLFGTPASGGDAK